VVTDGNNDVDARVM
jgi:hypothetical protein